MGAVISWANALERAGVDLSASSEAGGLGVQSVLSPTIAQVWRSAASGAATHHFEADLGAALPLRVFAAAAPRDGVLPGVGATWRVRGSNVSMGGNEAINSGMLQADMRLGVLAWLAPAPVSARYVQFSIYGVAGDPYLQLGRLWAGDALVTAGSVSYGWQRGVLDTGSSERASLSGVRNIQRGAVGRSLDFTLPRLTSAEAEALDDAALALGTTGQGLVAPFSTMARALFGRFTAPPIPAQPSHRVFSARIAFEEDL